jgi:hypothetical protein
MLRRLIRTPSSEQYALFDLDRTDANYDPLTIGKLDLHYTSTGTYGTFLLWREAIHGLPAEQVRVLVETAVQELCDPVGVPAFYAVEYFSPDLRSRLLHSNEAETQNAAKST